jgi:hypothetical protein
MKKILIILMMLYANHFFAQSVLNCKIKFSYDAAGNRIARAEECTVEEDDGNNGNQSGRFGNVVQDENKATKTKIDDKEKKASINASATAYPNPFLDKINVEYFNDSNNAGAKVDIIDSNGKILFTTLISQGKSSIDLPNLPPGVYIFYLIGKDFSQTWQLVKTNLE